VRPALANIITARVPEADLLIDTMTVRPQGNRAFLISDTIRRLKAADIWAKLDVLWMLAAHDAQAGRLNWKAPASFALTEVNSPTFTADRGYAGNGTTSYLDTGWAASTNGVQFQQNSASILAYNLSTAAGNGALIGLASGLGFNIFPSFSGSVFHRVADTPESGGFATASKRGFHHGDRQSSTARTGYRNGVSIGSYGSVTSLARSASVFRTHSQAAGSFSSDQIAMIGLGGSLNAEKDAMYSVLFRYMNSVGAE